MIKQIRTENIVIKMLISDFVELSQSSYPDLSLSVFVMGSLARGGFSEAVSDIDLGLVSGKSLSNAKEEFAIIKKQLMQKYPSIKNNISIFYGSVSEINKKEGVFRYPPFDRLDLIKHALLVSGDDIRHKLIVPQKEELLLATADFALDYLTTEVRINEFKNQELIIGKGLTYFTKTVLFPVRFIYFEKTGKISGNDVSVNYYLSRFKTAEKELVEFAFLLRTKNEISIEALGLLKAYLIPLYLQFLEIYIPVLSRCGKPDLFHSFKKWKEKLISIE